MRLTVDHVTRLVGGDAHLRDIAIELEPASVNILLGPTLAGKTSLMRVMAGLDRPTHGRVLVDGEDVTGMAVRKRNVAMVYQQFINYPSFTVYDNIASPLRRAGLPRSEIDRAVRASAERLKIEGLLDRLPAQLSGGQQQRTALARALVKDADLLLLDEPLVNLDYKLREGLREDLREIFANRRSTVVYATTEPMEALFLGGRTIVLDEGRVVQSGPTVEVYHHPASMRVGEIFSDPPMNVIAGTIERGEAILTPSVRAPLRAQLKDLRDGTYRFGVRANHLSVARRSQNDIEFAAPVELAEISGSETFVHVGLDGTSWVVQEEGVHPMRLGERIRVFLDPADLYVFDPAGDLIASPRRAAAPPAAA